MKSITSPVSYFANPMGYSTPDFKTNITIYENGDFSTDGEFSERSIIRSWYHEKFPNGSYGLTIRVKSNIAQTYDKFDPEPELINFLQTYLANQQQEEKFEWPPR